ncbi:MAG: AI-2E family transporter, partial [Thermomicrobiales bacterium]|nr:AI-2E family transporter [Thermomicrobiales bacterium]
MDGMPPPEGRQSRRPERVTVEIASRTLLLLAAFAALVWFSFQLSNLLLILLFAVLLATAIDEPVSWLERRGIPRPFGILAHYIVLFALFVLVALVLIPLIGSEIRLLRAELPAYRVRLGQVLGGINPDWAGGPSLDRVTNEISGNIGQVAGRLTALSLDVARTLIYGFITFVLAFFLAAEPNLLGRLAGRFV